MLEFQFFNECFNADSLGLSYKPRACAVAIFFTFLTPLGNIHIIESLNASTRR